MFYKILVGFKYHRRPWANIFDTNTCRSINIPKKAKHTLMYCASKNVFVKDFGSWGSMVLQKYQTFLEVTSNMIYIVAIGGSFKCPHKIQLNTRRHIVILLVAPLGFSDLPTALHEFLMWLTRHNNLGVLVYSETWILICFRKTSAESSGFFP